MADELVESAEQINLPRLPELEFVRMAATIISAGYFASEELADTSTAERAQIYKISSEGRAGWARLLRKVLGAKSRPTGVEMT